MEIRTLKSFITVATLKSFSAAARELNTVQPAISKQISDLEEELGVSLFWRNTREVIITAAGESLLREAQEILARERQAKDRARRAAHGEIGHLRIGYLASACFSFMPTLVQRYFQRYPDVHVSLQELTVRQQIDAFSAEQLDVGFSRPMSKTERVGFSVEEIYVDTLTAVLPETHSLAHAKSLRLRELEAGPFVLFARSEAVGLFDQIISACQQEKFAPNISSQPGNMQTVLTEVAAGLGVSIVPGCVRRLYTKGCAFVPIQKQKPSIPTELHYRSAPSSPTVEAFVELTMKAKQEIQRHMLK
jgi:DNA-binding transcriptional LysR family regulator